MNLSASLIGGQMVCLAILALALLALRMPSRFGRRVGAGWMMFLAIFAGVGVVVFGVLTYFAPALG